MVLGYLRNIGSLRCVTWRLWGKLLFRWDQNANHKSLFIVTSPQHKCLGEWNSYERAPDSAEKQQTIYLWTDSAKKQQTIYIWTDSAKNNNRQFTYGQTVQKKQQQFTYGQYIFTDCTEDNVQNTHTYTQYT